MSLNWHASHTLTTYLTQFYQPCYMPRGSVINRMKREKKPPTHVIMIALVVVLPVMHDFLLSNLIVRPKSLVCDLDSLE